MSKLKLPIDQSPEVETIFRDSPQRSILKTFTYRIFASGAMFVAVFIYSHEYQSLSLSESFGNAGFIAVIEFLVKLLHPRAYMVGY